MQEANNGATAEQEFQGTTQDSLANVVEITRSKILYALEIFPFINASMIHMGIGTSTSTSLWKPILNDLINEGLVQETVVNAKSPLDRNQLHTVYHLPKNLYVYGPQDTGSDNIGDVAVITD